MAAVEAPVIIGPLVIHYLDFFIDLLSEIIGIVIPFNPEICLFGILDKELWLHYNRTFLREVLFPARKAIALQWRNSRSPSLSQWRDLVNSVILLSH